MNAAEQSPETLHSECERGRIQVQGQRTDDNSNHTPLIVHEAGGSWTVHGLGVPGITLPGATMVALAKSILARAR